MLLGFFYTLKEENEIMSLGCKTTYVLSLCFFLNFFMMKKHKILREIGKDHKFVRCTKI